MVDAKHFAIYLDPIFQKTYSDNCMDALTSFYCLFNIIFILLNAFILGILCPSGKKLGYPFSPVVVMVNLQIRVNWKDLMEVPQP